MRRSCDIVEHFVSCCQVTLELVKNCHLTLLSRPRSAPCEGSLKVWRSQSSWQWSRHCVYGRRPQRRFLNAKTIHGFHEPERLTSLHKRGFSEGNPAASSPKAPSIRTIPTWGLTYAKRTNCALFGALWFLLAAWMLSLWCIRPGVFHMVSRCY